MSRKTEVNKEAVKAVVDYIMGSQEPQYTFEGYLKPLNKWNGFDDSGKNSKIECPFHNDDKPSFYMSKDTKLWKCFSCDRGGTFLDLVKFVNELLLGSSTGFYRMLNNILAEDKRMQLMTGFSTVFTAADRGELILDFSARRFKKPAERIISNYAELADQMKREGLDSIANVRLAILYMQDGYSAQDTYRSLKGGQVSSVSTSPMSMFDINDILNGDASGEG